MPQILLKPTHIQGNRFSIDGEEAHHLIHVLRKQPGDIVFLFDGQGRRYQGVLTAVDLKAPRAEGKITKTETRDARSPKLRLFQGLIKGPKFDFVIEKATELGVDEIFPFVAERGVVKIDVTSLKGKRERWRRLAEAASKQCGRASVPIIHEGQRLAALEPHLRSGFSFVLWEEEKETSLRRVLSSIAIKDEPYVNFVIGPEGGLTRDEIGWLLERGVKLASLGEQILRSETAGLAVLSILNYELGFFERV